MERPNIPSIITNDEDIGYGHSANFASPLTPTFPTMGARVNARSSPARADSPSPVNTNNLRVSIDANSPLSPRSLSKTKLRLRDADLEDSQVIPESPVGHMWTRDRENTSGIMGASTSTPPGERRISDAGRRLSRAIEEPLLYRTGAKSSRTRLSLTGVRSFLMNPLAIPLNHPYIRLLATLVVYGLTLTVLTSSLSRTSVVGDSSIIQRLKGGTSESALSDDKISVLASQLRESSVFPLPPHRPLDTYASPNSSYRAVLPLRPPPVPFPQLRATKFLPDKCLEGWFAHGEMMCSRAELGEEDELDVTYLWVNGSDSRWKEKMIQQRVEKGIYSPEHHFRENDELKYSMRSLLANMPGHLRTIHLITADAPFNTLTDMDFIPPNPTAWKELESLADEDFVADPKWTKSGKASAGIVPKEDTADLVDRAGGPSDDLIHANSKPKPYYPETISNRLTGWLDSAWRVAQMPTWLDFDRIDLADPKHPWHHLYSDPLLPKKPLASHLHATTHPSLRYAIHSEIFHLPTHKKDKASQALGAAEWREHAWQEKALPTYNSMAIESRIGWLWGLADVSLSFNDDFFMLKKHSVADWWSSLYGTVLRLDYNYNQQVRPVLDKRLISDAGESGGLYHANWLLSQRFPRRLRPYFAHVPKVITRGLHHEASIMFEDALTTSSQRKFRELPIGEGDVQMQWLLTALRIERWREAMLWTWVVAKVGTKPMWSGAEVEGTEEVGVWGNQARSEVRQLFGMAEEDTDVVKIEIHRGARWTTEQERMTAAFEDAGWEPPLNTELLWSSMDGHIPPLLKKGQSDSVNGKCTFDLERCFGRFWSATDDVPSDEMFKRLAFSFPACGDCLLMALVTASGPLGLSAILPPPNLVYKTEANDALLRTIKYLPPPHLPLTPTWQEADFSLESVLSETTLPGEPVNIRKWTMQLMSRYLYLSGRSISHFHMAKSPDHVKSVFKMVDGNPSVSLLGFNDDIETEYEKTRALMGGWFQKRWPIPAVWEKDWLKYRPSFV